MSSPPWIPTSTNQRGRPPPRREDADTPRVPAWAARGLYAVLQISMDCAMSMLRLPAPRGAAAEAASTRPAICTEAEPPTLTLIQNSM